MDKNRIRFCSSRNNFIELGYWEIIMLGIFFLIQLNSIQAQINVVEKNLNHSKINHYSFLVGGHYYGNASNTTGLPVNTVLANLDLINADLYRFHVALGDVFLDVRNDISLYEKKFFSKIYTPFYIAVGNHDVSGSFFEDEIGKTSVQFTFGNDVHLILDTEKNDGSIEGDQLALLKRTCNSDCQNIFIYSHRPIWSEEDSEMKGLFKNNTTSTFGLNFQEDILPLIQTAVRGIKRDGLLQVSVDNGAVSFKPVSLTGQNLMSLESYNLAFWRDAHPLETFNPRLIKLYLINMFTHRYFWYGIVLTLLLFTVSLLILKRIRK